MTTTENGSTPLPAIMYETGLDESFLVGTKEELRAFAQGILERLAVESRSHDYLGIRVTSSGGRMSEPLGDVGLDGIVVTETSTDTKRLVNAIRMNNGLPVIAADGWPQ